jgi:hypothetical protein
MSLRLLGIRVGAGKESTSTGRPHAPEGNPMTREEVRVGDREAVHLDGKATPSNTNGWEELESGSGRVGRPHPPA